MAMKPTGDCFYEAIGTAFSTVREDVRDCEAIHIEDEDTQAMALRRTAAMSVTQDVFQSFSMFHLAGLPDFNFMKRVRSLVDLQSRLLVTGAGAGAGQCLWANEWEIGLVCSKLNIVCLIIDNQAKEKENRFVRVGEGGRGSDKNKGKTRFVILQRSRREHYDLVYTEGQEKLALFTLEELSDSVKKLWQL